MTIAGSDSSAGAGIQQDLKTITAHGCYGATVITSITSQNTLGVHASLAVPAGVVASQINAVLTDLKPAAIKIGMIPNKDVAEAIVEELKPYLQQHPVPVVYDPVMVSTSGFWLKGGHADGDVMTDVLHLPDGTKMEYSTERIVTRNLHGTGCTLSSAIASNLALGCNIQDAVSKAKAFITAAIRRSVDVNIGGGNGPILPD